MVSPDEFLVVPPQGVEVGDFPDGLWPVAAEEALGVEPVWHEAVEHRGLDHGGQAEVALADGGPATLAGRATALRVLAFERQLVVHLDF